MVPISRIRGITAVLACVAGALVLLSATPAFGSQMPAAQQAGKRTRGAGLGPYHRRRCARGWQISLIAVGRRCAFSGPKHSRHLALYRQTGRFSQASKTVQPCW